MSARGALTQPSTEPSASGVISGTTTGPGNSRRGYMDVRSRGRQRDVGRREHVADLTLTNTQPDRGRTGPVWVTRTRDLGSARQSRRQPHAALRWRENPSGTAAAGAGMMSPECATWPLSTDFETVIFT